MSKIRKFFALPLLGAVFLIPATEPQARAATPEGSQVMAFAQSSVPTVNDILQHNKQARQVGPNRVRIADGVDLVLPNQSGVSERGISISMESGACDWHTGYLCVWEHAAKWPTSDGTGLALSFYYCDNIDLGHLRYPDGAWMPDYVKGERWNDRISALNNHQTRGTEAVFYNFDGGSFHPVLHSTAPDRRANLTKEGVNDIIDLVDPC